MKSYNRIFILALISIAMAGVCVLHPLTNTTLLSTAGNYAVRGQEAVVHS